MVLCTCGRMMRSNTLYSHRKRKGCMKFAVSEA
jgi:hypothetical protein